jgi:hypothetical protein
VLYAFNFAMTIQSPGTTVSLEVCSFSSIDDQKVNYIPQNNHHVSPVSKYGYLVIYGILVNYGDSVHLRIISPNNLEIQFTRNAAPI